MFRSLSRKVTPRGREKRRLERLEGAEQERAQMKLQDDLMKLGDSLVKYNTVPSLVPNTRNGTKLFHVRESSVEEHKDVDRVLYEMPMPENVDALTDLIKIHEKGNKFPYVGIVGSEGETLDARRSRLLSLKPSLGMRNIPEIEVTGCPLIDTEGEFSMASLMRYAVSLDVHPDEAEGPMPVRNKKKNFAISKQYVHIKSITGLYTPNMSSTSDFCRLWFLLVDNRMVNSGKSGQSNALVSNQEGVMEMSCDYCVPVQDLENFVLGYTLEREILKPGHQWGTVSFYFNIVESDIPYQSSKRDALAVYRMPITTLVERNTNADKSDISFTSRDLVALRQLYKEGDIVDVDEPQKARMKKSNYSKSTLRGMVKGEEINVSGRDDWGFMKGSRKPQIEADIASMSNFSGSEESDMKTPIQTKLQWEKQQEKLREMQRGEGKELSSFFPIESPLSNENREMENRVEEQRHESTVEEAPEEGKHEGKAVKISKHTQFKFA